MPKNIGLSELQRFKKAQMMKQVEKMTATPLTKTQRKTIEKKVNTYVQSL